jgi:ribonuclease HI
MSEHKIRALQRVSGHSDITGNKKADALAKKAPFYHTNHNTGRFQTVLSKPQTKGTSGG